MLPQIVLSIAVLAAVVSPVTDRLPKTLNYDDFRALPVQHDGRYPPFDTLARDVVDEVTGSAFFAGDPVGVLLAWTFDPQTWAAAPLIDIGNAELRKELQLPSGQEVYSYNELIEHRPLRSLIDGLSRVGDRKLNPLEAKVSAINGKLGQLQAVFAGRVFRPIPDASDPKGRWQPIRHDAENLREVRAALLDVKAAFLADDAAGFDSATGRLATLLAALPTAYRVDASRIATELRYNALRPFRTAWIGMLIGAALSAVALFARRRACDMLAIAGLIAGFGLLTYGLYLRWQVAGRIPASNMFESLLFVSWGMGAFAIISIFVMNHRMVPLTASAMGAVSLILADSLPMDSFIRPIAPVLSDTVWMSIHVPVIMVSYSVLTLAVLIAHVQLFTMAFTPGRTGVIRLVDSMHYWYVHVGSLLLYIGIITGSMWAASSWGRYWGWDPKEVWSLVAFLGYMTILHVRINREKIPRWAYGLAAVLLVALLLLVMAKMTPLTPVTLVAFFGAVGAIALFLLARGEFATALKSVLAFWLIIMTYVGVNYVLGVGLHSYGFGTGAAAKNMFLVGGIDLAAVGLCCAVYLSRLRSGSSSTGHSRTVPA